MGRRRAALAAIAAVSLIVSGLVLAATAGAVPKKHASASCKSARHAHTCQALSRGKPTKRTKPPRPAPSVTATATQTAAPTAPSTPTAAPSVHHDSHADAHLHGNGNGNGTATATVSHLPDGDGADHDGHDGHTHVQPVAHGHPHERAARWFSLASPP